MCYYAEERGVPTMWEAIILILFAIGVGLILRARAKARGEFNPLLASIFLPSSGKRK